VHTPSDTLLWAQCVGGIPVRRLPWRPAQRTAGARSHFIHAFDAFVHNPFTLSPPTFTDMADFLFAVGVVGFVLVMLGLIWALDRV
jgi:hypothetical protein